METLPLISAIYTDTEILSIDMVRPSNFHSHMRRGAMMQTVAYDTMRWVKHLLVMPNTGPIDTVEKVKDYHRELTAIADSFGLSVNLIMTIYLTGTLTPRMIDDLMKLPFCVAVKYYPPHKGATTGSGLGIPLRDAQDTLRHMEDVGMRLLGHFESVEDSRGRELPHAKREGYFMQHEFPWLRNAFPDLNINIEHGSTINAIKHVVDDPSGRTTIGFTPHHLLLSIDDLMDRSWRNHGRCMPIPKTPDDVAACRAFATSGDRRAHLGDDTAPHPARSKQGPFETAACGCWLPHSLALYARAFHMERALGPSFVQFACLNGPRMWGLPEPDLADRVRLVRETVRDIPEPIRIVDENDVVIPLGWTEDTDRLLVGTMLDQ